MFPKRPRGSCLGDCDSRNFSFTLFESAQRGEPAKRLAHSAPSILLIPNALLMSVCLLRPPLVLLCHVQMTTAASGSKQQFR